MGRVITPARIADIAQARKADPEALGPILGEMMIAGNVPVETVSTLMAVSEPTIYRWMYGFSTPTDADKVVKLKRLLTILRKAKRAKDLPLHGSMRERVAAMRNIVATHNVPSRSE